MKLDLGCGPKKKEGFLGVDSRLFEGVDVIHDLRKKPWPWKDGSVDEIYSRHFLEHLTGQERIIFFDEIYRVLKDDGIATIITPHWSHECAYGDPTHQWPPVTNWTYYYLNKEWRLNYAPHTEYQCNFDYELMASHALNDQILATQDNQAKKFMMSRNINTACELIAHLTKS